MSTRDSKSLQLNGTQCVDRSPSWAVDHAGRVPNLDQTDCRTTGSGPTISFVDRSPLNLTCVRSYDWEVGVGRRYHGWCSEMTEGKSPVRGRV